MPSEVESPDSNEIDFQMMLKVSEVASTECTLEQMVSGMMKSIIENSAAQRGIFLLMEPGGELLVVAEGNIDYMQIESLRAIPLSSCSNSFPKSITLLVQRSL